VQVAKNPDVVTLAVAGDSTKNDLLVRAPLFTSVFPFGIDALVIGLSVLFALIGFDLTRPSPASVTTSAHLQGAAARGVKP
jgi:hypothetical protein